MKAGIIVILCARSTRKLDFVGRAVSVQCLFKEKGNSLVVGQVRVKIRKAKKHRRAGSKAHCEA